MKKIVLLIVLITGLIFSLKAQDKVTIGILAFTYDQGSVTPQYVNQIEDAVTNAFINAKRFNIVDRSKMDAIKNEKEMQKSEDFINGSTVAQGASLGAQFLIEGHVNSASASEGTYQDSKTGQTKSSGFTAKLSISLQVIDVSTGQIIVSGTIEPKGGSTFGQLIGTAPTSANAAISKAIQGITDKINDFVQKNFPILFSISEIQKKDSKGGATEILIAGGSAFGLKKGDVLKVIELVDADVNGKKVTRKKEVGEIKITKVEDENFSVCDVKSGGGDITTKFEAKAKLQVLTKTE